MDRDTRKQIERALLEQIDQLIECGIEVSGLETDKRELAIKRGQELVCRILSLLTQIFFGPSDYYETILKQLVGQRLPSTQVLDSFGDFSNLLNEMIVAGIAHYTGGQQLDYGEEWTDQSQVVRTNPVNEEVKAEQIYNSEETATEETLSPLGRSLRILFPHSQILTNKPFQGTVFEYFLPDQRLAVELNLPVRRESDRRKLLVCAQSGIGLVRINPEDAGHHKQVQREIRRQTRVTKKH